MSVEIMMIIKIRYFLSPECNPYSSLSFFLLPKSVRICFKLITAPLPFYVLYFFASVISVAPTSLLFWALLRSTFLPFQRFLRLICALALLLFLWPPFWISAHYELNCHKEEDIQFSGCQNLWHPSEAYKLFDHNNHYTSTLISLLLPLLTRHSYFSLMQIPMKRCLPCSQWIRVENVSKSAYIGVHILKIDHVTMKENAAFFAGRKDETTVLDFAAIDGWNIFLAGCFKCYSRNFTGFTLHWGREKMSSFFWFGILIIHDLIKHFRGCLRTCFFFLKWFFLKKLKF